MFSCSINLQRNLFDFGSSLHRTTQLTIKPYTNISVRCTSGVRLCGVVTFVDKVHWGLLTKQVLFIQPLEQAKVQTIVLFRIAVPWSCPRLRQPTDRRFPSLACVYSGVFTGERMKPKLKGNIPYKLALSLSRSGRTIGKQGCTVGRC